MTSTTISVLTPSYQYARFLGDALESASEQAFLKEHIVVDGASTDGTVDVLASRASEQLIWKSEPDDGQSDALNRALSMAGGEWIGWLNADEFYLPGAFEAVAGVASRSDADVIFGSGVFVDESGHLIRLLEPHRFSRQVLRHYGPYMLSAAIFFRRAILPPDPWDVSLRTIMDWDVYLRLAASNARFAQLRRPLSAFRIHDAQVTATPLAPGNTEHRRVRQRYHIVDHPSMRLAGKAEHMFLRGLDGHYLAEWRTRRRFAGADMRWFDPYDGPAAHELISSLRRPRRDAR